MKIKIIAKIKNSSVNNDFLLDLHLLLGYLLTLPCGYDRFYSNIVWLRLDSLIIKRLVNLLTTHLICHCGDVLKT